MGTRGVILDALGHRTAVRGARQFVQLDNGTAAREQRNNRELIATNSGKA